MPLLLHRINQDLDKLKADGCQLVEPKPMFAGLFVETNGDPCTTGCAFFCNGKCPAYLKHHSIPVDAAERSKAEFARSQTDQSGEIGGKWAGMTVKQIAAKEGISLNECRRRKSRGDYRV